MDETNFDWDDLRLFLAVAREGGLAAAAHATAKSPPTLGRRMLALERRLGLELFERQARGYALTDQGQTLLNKVSTLESQIAPLTDTQAKALPLVKISAGTWVTHLLCQRMDDVTSDASVRLRFLSADHMLDISRREAVIGIRNQRPTQIGLAGRRIGRITFAVYARDASVSTWARVIGQTPSAVWLGQTIGTAPAIEVNNPRNALDLAQTGVARAVLPTFIGDTHPTLIRISDPIDTLTHDQWLVSHDDDRSLPQVRKVIDRVARVLASTST